MNSFLQNWTRFLLTTLSTTVIPSPTNSTSTLSSFSSSSSSSFKGEKKETKLKEKLTEQIQQEMMESIQPMMQSMFAWQKLHRGCLKTIDSALLIIQCVRMMQPKLFASENGFIQQNIEIYFQQLQNLQKFSTSSTSSSSPLHAQSFLQAGKHVISIEGLPSVGKSVIIQRLIHHHEQLFPGKYEKICYLSTSSPSTSTETTINYTTIHEHMWKIVKELPIEIQLIFLFLENYRLLNYIFESNVSEGSETCNVFIIENYYHSFLVNSILFHQLLRNQQNSQYLQYFGFHSVEDIEAKLHDNAAIFDWPFDLPMPELVLYFTCSTETRLQRGAMDLSMNVSSAANEDLIKSTLYSLVKGPGTVGIDTSGTIDEVFSTTIEALDYYGIYAITRPLIPVTDQSNPLSNFSPCEETKVTKDEVRGPSVILKEPSIDFSELPMEPEDVIYNRRISMGVYGMFSKFM